MPTLLKIASSPRGGYSISRALSAESAAKWEEKHAEEVIVERDLVNTSLPFVDLPWIAGALTPAELHSPAMSQALAT